MQTSIGVWSVAPDPIERRVAQRYRAQVYLEACGRLAMGPADVLQLMCQETQYWIKDKTSPEAAPLNKALFGGREVTEQAQTPRPRASEAPM